MPVTKYIWDGENCLMETDGTGAVQTVYTYEPEQYGNLISSRVSGTTYYHHYDALGSTRQLSNAAGAVSDTWIYDAWGNTVARTGATALFLQWIGQVGYYYDPETGTFWVRERPYGAENARWTTADLVRFPIQFNLYTYGLNSPFTVFDPSGLFVDDSTACDDKEMTCREFTDQNKISTVPGKKTGEQCPVVVRCADDCGHLASTTVVGGKISICLSKTIKGESNFKLLWTHELFHAKQYCRLRITNPPNCRECIIIERDAYDLSCKSQYTGFARGSPEFDRCVKCGIFLSCRKVCKADDPSANDAEDQDPRCTNSDIGIT